MPKINLTAALKAEYQSLFDSCQVNTAKASAVEKAVDSLIANRARYQPVGETLSIPWFVIAAIHNMECSQNFKLHLHNGDPLTARTTHVPAGRPKTGNPPFTWEDSAVDALRLVGLDKWKDWSVPGMLYSLEGYNGWGYRNYHPDVKTPYLWSGSNHYVSGKYVADGTWSATAVSTQLGAATLLRRIAEKVGLDTSLSPVAPAQTAMPQSISTAPLFVYAPSVVNPSGVGLQRYLNTLPNVFLKEDGKLGQKTSDACKLALGHYLSGDPRL